MKAISSRDGRERPSWPAVIALLCAAVMLAYGGALGNGFVWDDSWLRPLTEGSGLGAIPRLLRDGSFQPPEEGIATYYRPVSVISLALDAAIWGGSAAGFHATNLLMHLGVAMTLFALCRRLLPAGPGRGKAALWAAALYAVLPAHVGTVAYISGRSDSLAALFALAAMLLHTSGGGRRPALAIVGSGVFSALAMFSKEWAILVPIILILWDLFPSGGGRLQAAAVRGRLPWWSAQLGALAVYFLVRAALLPSPFARSGAPAPAGQMILTAPAAALYYFQALIWPGPATRYFVEIPLVSSPLDLRFLAGVATVAALLALGFFLVHRAPGSSRGLILSAVSGGAVILLYPLAVTFEASYPADERHLYFPAAGLALALAFPLNKLVERDAGRSLSGPRRLVRLAGPAVALLAWSVCSQARTSDWRTDTRLFETLARTSPRSSVIRYNLGVIYQGSGRTEEAIRAYEEAVRLAPRTAAARNNLGVLYEATGNLRGAEEQYRSALELEPSQASIHFNLAWLLHRQGRLSEAIATYRRAIASNPLLVDAHLQFGKALSETGDRAGALLAYREAARIAPSNAEAHDLLGAALAASGNMAEGIVEMTRGLRLDPGNDRVRNDLGAALVESGRPAEALALLDEALSRWPKDPTAHYNRGNALRGLGRKIEAVESYRKALALSPMYGKALNNLSVTLTELGRYEEALAALDQLVRVEPASARAHSNRGLVLRSLGRGEEARREFERAVQLDPAMAGAAPHLRGVGAAPVNASRN
jgi:Flp pilus assembly protein TadD